MKLKTTLGAALLASTGLVGMAHAQTELTM